MKHCRAYTFAELMVTLAVVALLIAIVLPLLKSPRRTERAMRESTQVRGIHTGLVLYAQGNNGFYPGLNSTGDVVRGSVGSDCSISVECRYQELLYDNYFTGEFPIAPEETKTPWTTGAVTTTNYSYAMLEVSAGQRRNESRETSNSEAPVLADRAKRNGHALKSVRTNPAVNTSRWEGWVGFNDNHVTLESDHTVTTIYGSASASWAHDDLFQSPGSDDALFIAAGTNLITID